MEYLTNSSNMSSLFEFNKESNKEYESYEKYLKFYYQIPSKKDPYNRSMVDGKYILSDLKNPSKKIIIDPAKYVNLFELFKNKINNDWWLYSKYALEENCADEIVNIECTETLTKKTEIIEKGGYKYTYSKCPLISNHIKKEKSKNNDDVFFFPLF